MAGFHPSARDQRQVRTLDVSAGSAQGFGDNPRISRGTAPPFTPAGGACHLESYTRHGMVDTLLWELSH